MQRYHRPENHKIKPGNLTDEERYRLGIYHAYDDEANGDKLEDFYGKVAAWENAFIMKSITGRTVLDVGAGYGLLTRSLKEAGFYVIGIDPCRNAREFARKWYGVDLLPADIHHAPFSEKSFDTAIIREAVEHLDFERTLDELKRIISKEIIIFQTNLSWIVQAARWFIRHHEYNAQPLEYYVRHLKDAGFTIKSIQYHDTLALPLSGGLLTKQWYPSNEKLQDLTIRFDDCLNELFKTAKVSRFFCWRHLVHAIRGNQI